MHFKSWITESIIRDFLSGILSESIFDTVADIIVAEAAAAAGSPGPGWYRIKAKYDNAKLGVRVGDEVWYGPHMPSNQKIVPVNPKSQSPAGHQPSTAPMRPIQTRQGQDDGQEKPWWYLSNVIGQTQGLKTGQQIAVSKGQGGDWNYITLDGQEKRGQLSGQGINTIIQSVRD